MDFDPVALLRPWPLDVSIGGQVFTIPARPAADWLIAYGDYGYPGIVPGLVEEGDLLDDMLMDGDVTWADCAAVARAALAVASGMRKWWAASRLMSTVPSTWVGHRLVMAGVDPTVVPLAAYLAAGYATAQREMKEETLARFDHELEAPPDGVPVEDWYDEDEAADLFMAAMNSAPSYDQAAA
jgi:hypothetical protein